MPSFTEAAIALANIVRVAGAKTATKADDALLVVAIADLIGGGAGGDEGRSAIIGAAAELALVNVRGKGIRFHN